MVKLTAKALLEKIDKLEKAKKAKLSKLSKLKQAIAVLMCVNVNKVKSEFNKYTGLCEETHHVHKTLLGLLPNDEAEKHDIRYKAKTLNVNDFIAVTIKWLS